ncbi:MAG: hypothetical protein ABH954_04630 [Candidatus Omnitrophota bacterium]
MPKFLTLVGMACAIAGGGTLVVLLLAMINNQIPLDLTGVFLTTLPFAFIIIAAILLTRNRI